MVPREFVRGLDEKPIGLGEGDTLRVLRWRARLIRKGFVVDKRGAFDQHLENATRVAQHWAGIKADGLVDANTWKAVGAKRRSPRPIVVVRNVLLRRPKIVDVRHGEHGFPLHKRRRWKRRTLLQIKAKLGHYTGGPASFVSDARFHVYSDYLSSGGAPAIAYHLGVDKDGTIFLFNDWDDVTWHCDGGHNTDTLGIVFRGAAEGPNALQQKSLRWLWRALEDGKFGFDFPRMPVRSTTHKHVNATSCPGVKGEAFYRKISRIFVTSLDD